MTQKFRDVYTPTLKANFVLWPAVQILNFRVIPIQFQIVSSSALPCIIPHTNTIPAICLVRWHCVDSIPLPHQLGGRGLTLSPLRMSPSRSLAIQCSVDFSSGVLVVCPVLLALCTGLYIIALGGQVAYQKVF